MAERRAPVSTYRLQLTAGFGFAAAGALATYLADLGVTHVYLSPVLQAAPGSRHGYDVTDHSRVSADLGGEEGFRAMAARLRASGLGIVLDIVPNHMAIPVPETLNRQLWTVLRDGPGARYANWFDVDWAGGGGRMLLPILGGPVSECLEDLAVDQNGGPVLRYFDHVLPLRPGTAGLALPELLDAQHYRLAWWHDVSELNWRRFFDITTLIGVRVEDPAVFDATHSVVLRLVAEGLVDGLRVDHPDGLADPRGYLRRLASAAGSAWIVVEKILAPGEALPRDWPCAGTTGYDALRLADGLFVDPDGAGPLAAEYARFSSAAAETGRAAGEAGAVLGVQGRVPAEFREVAYTAKREVAAGILAPEVTRLARLLRAARPGAAIGDAGIGGEGIGGAAIGDAREVLTEVLAAFGVYRAYVYPPEPPADAAEAAVGSAVAAARERLPERLRELAGAVGSAALGGSAEFAVRFGQTTGPVLAKGVEDTAGYRWPRLVALNEVGGDPDRVGVNPAEFHAAAIALAASWPATMTTLSTHDTKREEDVRARLAVLAEMPAEWGRQAAAWHAHTVPPAAAGARMIDAETEYLLWQTLVGAWPLDGERLAGYLTKAVREAKTRTSWLAPDAGYEAAVLDIAARVLGDPWLRASIGEFVASITADAAANSLGAKLVQLTMPGVADVYQGCELTGLSLVDPDNRRPVDFGLRRRLLAALDAGQVPARAGPAGDWPAGGLDATKLLVTARTLRLRRCHPDWFLGSYAPLAASGPAADHAVAFSRGDHAVTVATRLPRSLRRRGGWAGTTLPLPDHDGQAWRDELTGETFSACPQLSDLTRRLPVALLVPEAR